MREKSKENDLSIPKQHCRYIAVMLLYKKRVWVKSQAFPVEGVQFLRKMSGAYLFCFLLSPEDGKLWGGCKFGGSWGCRSDGRAQRVHCWASNLSWEGLSQESPRGWQWNATAEQRETLPHLGLPSSAPQARPPASSAGAGWPSALNHRQRQSSTQGEIRFITIQCFSLLKINWHVWENKRMLMGGAEPKHGQFSLQGWEYTGLSTAFKSL